MNIFRYLRSLWDGLFYGLKATDDKAFTQEGGGSEADGVVIKKQVDDHRVSSALLRGEVTQEVKELRYRTYKVDREAKDFEYYAPTLAIRRDKQDNKFISFENEDGLEVITVQPNYKNLTTIEDSIKDVDSDEDVNIGYLKPNHDCTIKFTRKNSFFPRYRVEDYLKEIVVKKIDDTHACLDLYFSIYENNMDFKSKGFITEIKSIQKGYTKSDVIDFTSISFVTNHAYKVVDMLEFEFGELEFEKVLEFDGHYILRFKSLITKNGIDEVMNKYYCKEMEDKYKRKERKVQDLNLFGVNPIKEYICERCGKRIVYDEVAIDELEAKQARDIFEVEEQGDQIGGVSEYLDAQMAEQTFGHVLCKECLKEYMKEQGIN
jgi:hypothetical protein